LERVKLRIILKTPVRVAGEDEEKIRKFLSSGNLERGM
jgi:hypothetical protein